MQSKQYSNLEIRCNWAASVVRILIARNPGTSIYILENLSNDSSSDVRDAVFNNPNTPPELKTFMKLKYS